VGCRWGAPLHSGQFKEGHTPLPGSGRPKGAFGAARAGVWSMAFLKGSLIARKGHLQPTGCDWRGKAQLFIGIVAHVPNATRKTCVWSSVRNGRGDQLRESGGLITYWNDPWWLTLSTTGFRQFGHLLHGRICRSRHAHHRNRSRRVCDRRPRLAWRTPSGSRRASVEHQLGGGFQVPSRSEGGFSFGQ